MSYIPPSPETNIYLLHGVPLDNTYDHTIYFRTEQEQREYFSGMAKYQFANQTFQRVNRNFLRVQAKIGDIYDCNYLMFQNYNADHHSRKWFYAFVLSVNYINEGCCEIEYELDVLQTWHFNYKLDHCFVERQHTETDNIGDNLIPEPLDTGEYVCNGKYAPIVDLSDMVIILGVVEADEDYEEPNDPANHGKIYDGIYGGLTLYWYKKSSAGISALNKKIFDVTKANAELDNVQALYQIPTYLVGEALITEDQSGVLQEGYSGTSMTMSMDRLETFNNIDGYHPVKNKKLFTFPYNFYHVDNGNGSELAIKYEFCNNHVPQFQFNGNVTQPCKITLRPINYKGATNAVGEAVSINTEILTLSDYPLCSWNVDSYKAWIAQNSIPLSLDTSLKLIGGIAGFMVGGPVGMAIGGVSALSGVTNALSTLHSAKVHPDILKGNFNCSNVNVSVGKQQFFGGRFSINAQYAKMIDDFFSRFGYALNALAVPNRFARPYWTYVKTGDCTITVYSTDQTQSGGVPNDDTKKICEIYNNGITWWRYRNDMDVGNYSLDNSPV